METRVDDFVTGLYHKPVTRGEGIVAKRKQRGLLFLKLEAEHLGGDVMK
jgi:hypothetical protein